MKEIEYQSNGQPVFITLEDLKEKLGYKSRKPKIGILGKALIKATKEGNRRSVGWMKKQLDELFKTLDKERGKNGKRKNKRFNRPSNVHS